MRLLHRAQKLQNNTDESIERLYKKLYTTMKKNRILLFLLTLVLAACNQKSPDADKVVQEEKSEKKDSENIIHRLPVLHGVDTVKSGKNVYIIEVHREAFDSLGIVTDDMGYRYADNSLKISVRKNGSSLFYRTFKKKDFLHLLDAEFAKHSILDGCRFLQVHEGMVSFSLAVSYPDSDMSRPFKLNIGPDGSYMIVKNDDLEDEYISDSLSSDGV